MLRTDSMTLRHTEWRDGPAPARIDALALLEADHEAVLQLFAAYEATRSAPAKKVLVAQICAALA